MILSEHHVRKAPIDSLTPLPASSGQILSFKTLAAIISISFWVSFGPTAAKTNMPFPIVDINLLSIVTEADVTRCIIAKH